MSRTVHPIREAMAELAREDLRGAEHPSPRRIVAYHRGELPAQEAAVVTEHLSLCRECTAVLLEAAEFLDGDAEEEDEAGAKETDEAWRALRAARGASAAGTAPELPVARATEPTLAAPPAPASRPRRPVLRRLSTAYGVAATFALLSLGLVFLPRHVKPPTPRVNEELYDLTSDDSERGGPSSEKAIRFSGPGSSALLILNPRGALSFERYSVALLDRNKRVVWTHDGLEPLGYGAFHVTLPAESFSAGSYVIELYGWRHDRMDRLGRYRIRIEE